MADVPILDLLSHRQEGLFDVGCVLSRGLQEGDAELIRELLRNGKEEDTRVLDP